MTAGKNRMSEEEKMAPDRFTKGSRLGTATAIRTEKGKFFKEFGANNRRQYLVRHFYHYNRTYFMGEIRVLACYEACDVVFCKLLLF